MLILITMLVGCALATATVFKVIPTWMGLAAVPALVAGCVYCWRVRFQQNRDEAVVEAKRVHRRLMKQLAVVKSHLSRLTKTNS